MSTRCTIAIEKSEGIAKSIYCHHDGYPSWTGKVLLEHFNSHEKALSLVTTHFPVRSLSGLELNGDLVEYDGNNEPVGQTHIRSVGIDLLDTLIRTANPLIEYIYLFKDGEWLVAKMYNDGGKTFEPLQSVVA